jgi:O-antigen biosynthesis protein
MTTTLSPITASVSGRVPRDQMAPNPGHIIVVLGMHRSGTSTVTRALQALGVSLGDNLLAPAVDNPKGFWEDRDCFQINEELLGHLGSAYDQPGLGWRISWSDPVVDELGVRAADVLKRRLLQAGGVWGFKDPRTCRLLEFWCPVMAAAGYTTSFVLAIRNPASVARSLERRNEIPCEKSYLLWLQHVIPAVVLTAGSPRRVVVDYDQMMDRPLSGLQRIATALGLRMDSASAAVTDFERDFLDESLRHTRFPATDLALDPRVPQQVAKVYDLLLDVANNRSSIDSPHLQQYFSEAYNFLADLTPVFRYADALEVERRSLMKSIVDQAEQLAGTEQSARLAEQSAHLAEQSAHLAEQSALLAEQQAAEQRLRAETAENEVKNQTARAENLSVQLDTALARLTAIESSPSWRALILIRSRLRSHPWIVRLARRGVRLFARQAGSTAGADQRPADRDVWFGAQRRGRDG